MRKMSLLIVLMGLWAMLNPGFAQEPDTARLRFIQIASSTATFFLDETVIVEGLNYPFTSDYMAVSPGLHMLAVAVDGAGIQQAQSKEVELIAGHDYTAAAINTNADFTAFDIVLVDETAGIAGAGVDLSGGTAILLNDVVGAPALDIYVNDERAVKSLSIGQHQIFTAPVGRFRAKATLADEPDVIVWEDDFIGLAHTVALGATVGVYPDWFNIVRVNSSHLPAVDYLAGLHGKPDNYFDTFYEALSRSAVAETLAGDGPFTLFVPTDEAFSRLPETLRDSLLTDREALNRLLGYHAVSERYPPHTLPEYDTLLTLEGSTLALTFPERAYWRINDSAQIIDDTRLPNGILYEIDAVLLPPDMPN